MNYESEVENQSSGIFAARALDRSTLSEESFQQMITNERRRTSRSNKPFLLMLLDMGDHSSAGQNRPTLRKILSILSLMLRETDVTGWYKEDVIAGVMFTEINLETDNTIPASMMSRVTQTLKSHLPAQHFRQIGISFHLLPEMHETAKPPQSAHTEEYNGFNAGQGAGESSAAVAGD